MYKKIATTLSLLIVLSIGAINPASAVNIGCVLNTPRKTSETTIESYSQWLNRQKKEQNNNACFTDTKALQNAYNSLAKKALLDLQSQDKNEFNKRYDACTKGVGASLNPKTWLVSLKCLFTTSFFPTADTLKFKFNELMADFKSHQPTSYIPIALGVINNIRTNWGGVECLTGAISATVPLVGLNKSLDYVIPCKPPTALQALRTLMVLAVWIGFAFWLYRTGVSFWKERSA